MQLPFLASQHRTELLLGSSIAAGLAQLNFQSLTGKACYDYLFIAADLPRTNLGQVAPGWLRRYQNCTQGGWWCAGLDPLAHWQPMEWGTFKPDRPKRDKEGRGIKYEHPPQMPTRLFCLRVDRSTWQGVAQRHGKQLPPEIESLPETGAEAIGFWPWVMQHKLPLVLCEGAKKAAALLSQGYVAIGLPGINSGYRSRKDANGNLLDRQPIPELAALLVNRPGVYVCFDYETKPKTIEAVNRAIAHLGVVCQESHCSVRVIRLPGKEKGVDEFLAARGGAAFETLYNAALDLETDLARTHAHHRLTYPTTLTLHQRYLSNVDFPERGLVGIKSAKGTGKTTALIPLVAQAQATQRPVLLLTHRIQLGRFLCERIGVNWINANLASPDGSPAHLGLCLDSLWKLNPEHWLGGVIILDEVEQSLWHLLNSATCKSKRLVILKTFQQLIARVLESGGLVVAQDADLSDVSIDYLCSLTDQEIEPRILVNEWQPETGWEVCFYDTPNPTALISQLEQDLLAGLKCYVTTDSRSGRYGSDILDKYVCNQLQHLENQYAKTLVICSQTTNTPEHPAVDFAAQVNDRVTEYDAVFVTPTLGTGVSIDVEHFDRVYGLFQGVIPDAEVRQALARVRANVPRHVWCTKRGVGMLGSGSNNYRSLAFWYQENYKESYALMCPHHRVDVDNPIVYDPVHLRAWSKFAARINASITLYRESIRAGLLAEGHNLQAIDGESDREKLAELRQALVAAAKTDKQQAQRLMGEIFALQQQLGTQSKKHQLIKTTTKNIQQQSRLQAAQAVANAPDISPSQYQRLTGKRFLTEGERQRVSKYMLQQRYGVTVTPELKLKDEQGYYSQLLTHFYLAHPQVTLEQSAKSAFLGQANHQPEKVFLPDANHYSLKIQGLIALGIPQLLDPQRQFRAEDPDLVSLQHMACLCSQHIKRAIGLQISADQGSTKEAPVAILGKFLGLLGLKLKAIKVTTDGRGRKTKVYTIDPATWHDGREQIFSAWHQALPEPGLVTPLTPPIASENAPTNAQFAAVG